MRVLVTGDRFYKDYDTIEAVLLGIRAQHIYRGELGLFVVCHGKAPGADSLADLVCDKHSIEKRVYPADWTRFKKAAGPIRNRQMLEEFKPELVVAFHDQLEQSSGTKDMIDIAARAGVPVWHMTQVATGVQVQLFG